MSVVERLCAKMRLGLAILERDVRIGELTDAEITWLVRSMVQELASHALVYRDDGQVVHEMRGDPNDIWQMLLSAALEEGDAK